MDGLFCYSKIKRRTSLLFFVTGRNDEIWTHDPFHPKEVRYQAALRPDNDLYYTYLFPIFLLSIVFSKKIKTTIKFSIKKVRQKS